MGRAELRRQAREQEKAKVTYTLTNEDINRIKKEATDKALDEAFILMLAIPTIVLRDTFDFGHKRLERFIDGCTDTFDSFQKDYLTLEDMHKALKKECEVEIVKVRDKSGK